MSFGWVPGSTLGKVLAKHSGPGYGVSSSHRAEGWGRLSGHRFLFHLSRFQQQLLPTNLQGVSSSDNAGLISRIVNQTKYQTVYTNSTLSPDWDVIEQIHATQTDIEINHLAYTWVKGHQDDPTLLHTPSVEATYNIEAGSLARQYLVHYGKPHPVSPVLPAAKCTLPLNDRTHSAHYAKVIRHAVSIPQLHKFLARKYQWQGNTVYDVDWELFGAAVK